LNKTQNCHKALTLLLSLQAVVVDFASGTGIKIQHSASLSLHKTRQHVSRAFC
jgi:hypothetical protein